ncbi:nitric oxide synthase-interacting protein isoform X1 [Amia ocellicauda]|uniref:nitric oxide synthase-interacting protein isoform X1 n=2 Tax=Amia ocellicauda TaxID=2972642 RepID=UPI00346482F0
MGQAAMTRHGKNCTAGAVYTYHEKKKDTAASGYGTQSVRLGKDAIKDFDCCCLSLQPCRDPVVTPEGYLYEREAILEYILHQKTEIAKKMKAYEKQKRAQSSEEKLLSRAPQDSRVQRFLKREGSIVSKPLNPFTTGEGGAQCSSEVDSKAGPSSAPLPSFWIPSLTPEAKPTTIKKPAKTVLCPMSGRPLKLSDLVSVRFTPLNASLNRVGLLTRQDRYVCAVTRDTLGNSVPCAVLRPSGSVVTMECVERLIRKDMTDPETGAKLRETDIIPLQRGGTGFSGSGVQLKAKESRPVMQV